MGIFDKKTQEKIHSEGGVMEMAGGTMTGDYSEEAAQLVKDISAGKTKGFFFAIEKTEGHSAGMGRLNGINKIQALEVVIRAFSLDMEEVVMAALMVKMHDEDSDHDHGAS